MQSKTINAFAASAISGGSGRRLAALLAVLLALLLWQPHAQAACTRAATDIYPSALAPKVSFDSNTPLGTVIGATMLVTVPANKLLATCTGGSGAMYIMGFPGGSYAAAAPGATNETQRAVYDVDNKIIPGLAMVIYVTYNGRPRVALSRADITYGSDVFTVKCNGCSSITSGASGIKIDLEFIKTQHSLQAVNMPDGAVAMLQFDGATVVNSYPFYMKGIKSAAKISCTVRFPANIDLGTINQTLLQRNGGSPDQLLRIGFSCNQPPSLTMRVRQSSGTAADSMRGILSNIDSGAKAANGTGVQIRADSKGSNERKPVELNKDQVLGKQDTATFNRDYYVRMVPLATPAVTPGTVRTVAIITATFD